MTTVYVGNLSPYTNQSELLPLFQQYGYVQEVRLQTDRGYAFVKMDSHEGAAQAIVNLNNYNINGKPLKLGVSAHSIPASLLHCTNDLQWGKDKNAPGNTQYEAFSPPNAVAGFSQSPGYFPQYGQQAMPAQSKTSFVLLMITGFETDTHHRRRPAVPIPKRQLRPVPTRRLQPHSCKPIRWLPNTNLRLPTTRHIPYERLPAVASLGLPMLAITNLLLCRPRKS
jgi:RNA recognition motif-containing protein